MAIFAASETPRGDRTNPEILMNLRFLPALAAAAALAGAAPVNAAALNSAQYTTTVSFAAGVTAMTNVAITPATPTGQVLVIQSISIYRYPPNPSNPSTLSSFLGITTSTGATGYFALPDVSLATTNPYPAGSGNLIAYVRPGTRAIVNMYRSGAGSYAAETEYITVSGYLTPGS